MKKQIVKNYKAAMKMPESVVIGRLSHYGKVLFFLSSRPNCRKHVQRCAYCKICVKPPPPPPIPSEFIISSEMVQFWYPTLPKTCRKCGDEKHLASGCKASLCSGHRVTDCHSVATLWYLLCTRSSYSGVPISHL